MNILKPLKIGKVTIPNRIFLSPMVDVTDLAYRDLCRRQGAGMCYTEMLYVNAILHENYKTRKLMMTSPKDGPVGLQVTANSVEEFAKFAKLKELDDYDLIDINCGCPSIRIVGSEAGSFLLKNPEKIVSMIKLLKERGLTVTAKIRLGFNNNNVINIAKAIEEAGADALTIHARLATQGNSIPADWKWIKKVKESLKIPVIGNGDIFSGADAERIFSETNCDGIMIARGALGNPFIFREIIRYFKTGKEKKIKKNEKIEEYRKYLALAKKYDYIDMSRIKYIGNSFLSGFDGSSKMREKFSKLKTFKEVTNFFKVN